MLIKPFVKPVMRSNVSSPIERDRSARLVAEQRKVMAASQLAAQPIKTSLEFKSQSLAQRILLRQTSES